MTIQKNKKLKQAAEKMALNDFDQASETHEFSDNYYQRKKAFLNTMDNKKNIAFIWTTKRIVITLIIVLFIIPSTTYAISKLYNWYVEKNQYQVSLAFDSNQTYTHETLYKLHLNYLPKNMVSDPDALKYSHQDNLNKGGLTFVLWKINQKADFNVLFSESYKETIYGGHKALLVKKTPSVTNREVPFNRRVFLLFEKEGYILEAYVGQDMPNEDLTAILSNITLKRTTKDNATIYNDFDDYQKQIKKSDRHTPKSKKLPLSRATIQHIGEPVIITPLDGKVQFTVEKVQVFDSIQTLNLNNFNLSSLEQLQENKLLDEQQRLLPFKQKIIKAGDGKNSLDQVIQEKTVKPIFIYLTASIKNMENHPLKELHLQDAPILLQQNGQSLVDASLNLETTALSGEVDYLDNHGTERHFYQLPTLKAKEKRLIHFGFFIDDYQLSQLYLPVFNYSANELDSPDLKLIDIRQ
ncbi:hypothetical protein CBF34_10940 [Vagococcus penaei]|uniref:Uncharacterized protein n=1 Tax=Vagococcus penaei TaxID=633807 RepID=A0A1Q2D6S4_9ENTE|nr:hypothetical protein [Vagococcus penaei]AQP54003.1 hypothetical protein BW732_07115 [Vagococcus penaei]RST97591.1 hypothetical protein CBF34_10940 [Vagococcus penaei]